MTYFVIVNRFYLKILYFLKVFRASFSDSFGDSFRDSFRGSFRGSFFGSFFGSTTTKLFQKFSIHTNNCIFLPLYYIEHKNG